MSTIETILSRAMNDTVFADALFAAPEKALAEYDLPTEVIAQFKNISRAKFEALATEARQSMAVRSREHPITLQPNGPALPNISWDKLMKP